VSLDELDVVIRDDDRLGEALLNELDVGNDDWELGEAPLDVESTDPGVPLDTNERSESCQAIAMPSAMLATDDALMEPKVVVTKLVAILPILPTLRYSLPNQPV
jgi:hypothetical protein